MLGKMSILNKKGDTAVLWDTEKPETVEKARIAFDEIMALPLLPNAFATKPGVGVAERITVFDPEVESVVIIPMMIGG